ncbi:MCP four helix bundle domain-containing protein [Marivirga salinae]|uniref:MCP four helix bundle domain-containing protein n=1 Tax=Marivirga salinarum TaxID=3059078 RepID=A0AA51RCQ3_9BACT|nr:MCP four helix bundle domain-containing protein [Marivirga sp. BDSF4-3]WMN12048.1 MCP four helix bundle domain-containing protein [Marivirga sp. BDSF4-3]
MHFSYFVQQKLKLASALAVILIIVLVNNRLQNNNLNELGDTFGSVYKDRLLVENYIFKMANATQEKKYLLTQFDSKDDQIIENEINTINVIMDSLIADYQKTYLTINESTIFKDYLQNNAQLRIMENDPKLQFSQLTALYDQNVELLNDLSKIQMKEGEALYNNSQSIVTSNASISYLELGLLIILGLISQALVFNSKSLNSILKKDQNDLPLN